MPLGRIIDIRKKVFAVVKVKIVMIPLLGKSTLTFVPLNL